MEYELEVEKTTAKKIFLTDLYISRKERQRLRRLLPAGVKVKKTFTLGGFDLLNGYDPDEIIIFWKETGEGKVVEEKVLGIVKKFLDERELLRTYLAV